MEDVVEKHKQDNKISHSNTSFSKNSQRRRTNLVEKYCIDSSRFILSLSILLKISWKSYLSKAYQRLLMISSHKWMEDGSNVWHHCLIWPSSVRVNNLLITSLECILLEWQKNLKHVAKNHYSTLVIKLPLWQVIYFSPGTKWLMFSKKPEIEIWDRSIYKYETKL